MRVLFVVPGADCNLPRWQLRANLNLRTKRPGKAQAMTDTTFRWLVVHEGKVYAQFRILADAAMFAAWCGAAATVEDAVSFVPAVTK